jgi:WD40 repeat protein
VAPLGEEGIRSLACTPDGRYVLAGSVSGTMARLDVRMDLKPLNTYAAAAGAIREIAVHPTRPLVAAVSLDRHLRVYGLEGKGELVQKVTLTLHPHPPPSPSTLTLILTLTLTVALTLTLTLTLTLHKGEPVQMGASSNGAVPFA